MVSLLGIVGFLIGATITNYVFANEDGTLIQQALKTIESQQEIEESQKELKDEIEALQAEDDSGAAELCSCLTACTDCGTACTGCCSQSTVALIGIYLAIGGAIGAGISIGIGSALSPGIAEYVEDKDHFKPKSN